MKLITLFTILNSFNLFAGDSSFICEDIATENLVIDLTINLYPEGSTITDSFIDYHNWDDSYTVSYNHQNRTVEIDRYDIHGGGYRDGQKIENLEYHQSIFIGRDKEYRCYLAD